ncbi:MAG: membrane associated rhomboid family serine protease [Parvicellaceae bacterium]
MSIKGDIREMMKALVVPVIFLVICWAVWLLDKNYHLYLYHYGVKPRTAWGALGILFSPFIHDTHGYSHIINNSSAMIVLLWSLFYFYKDLAWKVFLVVWLGGGLWLWCLSRDSFHIGASGIIYGLASYLFFSGMFRKNIRLMSLSMIVVFLYGGMIWGVLPLDTTTGRFSMDLSISFEGHLWGAAVGLLIAYVYRKIGYERKKYQWEIDEELGIEPPDFEGELRRQEIAKALAEQAAVENQVHVTYTIKKKDDN